MNFLYAAYAATWMIHLIYLWSMVQRYRRLRKDVEDLKKRS
ncbi:MAG TPA: CcmD family protein [Terriglobales bacterium]|jgi:CcmD family protein